MEKMIRRMREFEIFQSVSVLWITSFASFWVDSTYWWSHMVFVFVWLISLSRIISKSIHTAAHGSISPFLWLCNIPLYILPHLLYPFFCQWTFTLFPLSGLLWRVLQWTLGCRFWNQTYGYRRGNAGRRDELWSWDWHIHSTVYKIDGRQGNLLNTLQ